MTFLNPLVLLGLAAAAIPIIIHLLSLRKLRTIEFSSLRFLKELQKSRMRRVRIRQILLLIIRTLLIAALVFAFARPALRGSLAIATGGKAATTMVVLLDDSPSMEVRNERGPLFTQAKDIASRVITLAKDGDRVLLQTFSGTRSVTPLTPFMSASSALVALEHTTTSAMTVPLIEALAGVRRVVEESKDANREVYIITDGQASQLLGEHPRLDSSAAFDLSIRFFYMQVNARQRENAGVISVVPRTQIIARNKPVTFQSVVQNFGEIPLHNSVMSVYLEGSRVAQQSLEIPPGGSVSPTFTLTPEHRGISDGYVQLEDDQLEIDNRRFFVFNVPQNITVFMYGETLQDTKLPFLALTLGGDTSVAGLYSVHHDLEDRLPSADLSLCDVLVLSGIKDLSSLEVTRIQQFVRAGGGLVVFPGKGTDLRTYNEGLLPGLGIPPAMSVSAGVPKGEKEGGNSLGFDRIDFAHPIFFGLFEQPFGRKSQPPAVESPRILAAFEPRSGEQGHVIIGLSDGGEFLTEYPVGAGKVLFFAVDGGLIWSNFPVMGLFAPLLHRAMLYLSAQQQSSPAFVVGQNVDVAGKVGSVASSDIYFFQSPSGIQERIAPRFLASLGMVQGETGRSGETGVYRLMRTREDAPTPRLIQAAAVNVSPAESDLRAADGAEFARFWAAAGVAQGQVNLPGNDQPVEEIVQRSRFGVELWKYLVAFAILLAIAEMAVSRETKTETVTMS